MTTNKVTLQGLVFSIIFIFFFINLNAQNAGNTLNFDGTDDEVITIGYKGISGSNNRTVEFWVKTTSSDKTLVSWGNNSGGQRWQILVHSTGQIRIAVHSGNRTGTTIINDGEYHHVVVVFEDNGSPNLDMFDVKFYVDGVLETISSTTNFGVNTGNSNDVYIGNYFASSSYLSGNMDELRIWSDARTVDEVRDNMHKDLTPGSEANLDAYYKFDETSGAATVVDSKNSNDGTWSGSGGSNTSSNFIASNAVIGDATAQMQTNIRGIWEALGTNNSLDSDGLTIGVGTALTETNFAVFGHDNAGTGTTTNDLGSSAATDRFDQIWYVGEEGTVGGATTTFDLGTITNSAVTAGIAGNYILLFRAGTSGDFSDVMTAGSTANSDQVLVAGVDLQDGYYTLGTSNMAASPLTNSPPVVTITLSNPTLDEDDGTPFQYTVTRSGPSATDGDLTVYFTVSGSAFDNNVDFSVGGTDVVYDNDTNQGTIVISDTNANNDILITPLNDGIVEDNETIIVTLIPDPNP